uniref:Uncharacterized protein n=1 Tax=Brassica oleracea var. oleracea TaxID=109376 RepID=A0A0D2ZU15_BRAOL
VKSSFVRVEPLERGIGWTGSVDLLHETVATCSSRYACRYSSRLFFLALDRSIHMDRIGRSSVGSVDPYGPDRSISCPVRSILLIRPTPADLQRLLDVGEYRGFPGMIGSIDCMHWEWKNCPTAWKGQYSRGTLNDINVLDRSPVFDDIINGQAPQVTYSVDGREYHLAYYLTDVEDERDGYTQFDVSEFQQGEDNGSLHVDLTYSTDIPTNIANMMGVRTRIRDRQMHEQLKGDLVEHVWRKFGCDEDNQ